MEELLLRAKSETNHLPLTMRCMWIGACLVTLAACGAESTNPESDAAEGWDDWACQGAKCDSLDDSSLFPQLTFEEPPEPFADYEYPETCTLDASKYPEECQSAQYAQHCGEPNTVQPGVLRYRKLVLKSLLPVRDKFQHFHEYGIQTEADIDATVALENERNAPVTSLLRPCQPSNVHKRTHHLTGLAWDLFCSPRSCDVVTDWLLADGGENARRLGMMYICRYGNQIWRAYRNRRWEDAGTACVGPSVHDNHLHVAFSRLGGSGATSYWSAYDSAEP